MKLTNKTIGDLQGGAIGYAIDQAIREAMRDCEGRPGLKTVRKVVINVEFLPASGGLQEGASTLGSVGIKAKVGFNPPPRVGDTDYLIVESGADTHGEPEVSAHFSQIPLLPGGN
jgi:hypothetical protein